MARRNVVPDPRQQPTISVPEAGALLGLRPRTAYDARRRGEIPAIRVGRSWRVPTARFLREVLGLTE